MNWSVWELRESLDYTKVSYHAKDPVKRLNHDIDPGHLICFSNANVMIFISGGNSVIARK